MYQKFFEAKLGPDEAFEIDRNDIFEHANTNLNFIKGFVIIETTVELDVVAVYTAAGAENQVETLHVEHVSPRQMLVGLPDLVLSLMKMDHFVKEKPLCWKLL